MDTFINSTNIIEHLLYAKLSWVLKTAGDRQATILAFVKHKFY